MAQSLQAEDIVLRLLADEEEAEGLVEALRLVDLLELLHVALLVGVLAGLHEDGVGLGSLADGGLAVLGALDRTDRLPAEGSQMLRFDRRSPGCQFVVGEGLFGLYPRRLTDLTGKGLALGDLRLVDRRFQFFLDTILLHEFMERQGELFLRVAFIAHVDIDRSETALSLSATVVDHAPTVELVAWWSQAR